MKKIISAVFYLSLLLLPLTGRAEPAVVDKAIEVISLSINIDDDLNGYAIVKHCPDCADIRLKIDSTTQVTNQGKNIPLHRLNHLRTNSALVIFDPKTSHLKQIVW
ncbi:MAG TPA: hypothetical protein ENI68_11730 [Gammaproteobacteria bacterium]|nr:hypothetical protein [Gammaproteobacteria bacterium]